MGWTSLTDASTSWPTIADSQNVAESVRGVDDPINTAIAGCVAGGSIGIQRKKISYMCAGCLGAAMLTTLIDMG